MLETNQSKPVSLKNIKITDEFWAQKIELVRKEVIPYQWNALNDNIPEANPSFCMHNFKAAAKLNARKAEEGDSFVAPVYSYKGFEALPEDRDNPDPDAFYGFVFQDTDFSKWIEAVGYSLTQHPDEELEQIADGAIDIVCAAQQEDGYLDTYYIINGRDKQFTNLRDHHELYCLGHLVEGAVAYYEATGKDKLLNAARRFADYVYDNFGYGEGKIKGYPGHEIAEMALIRLYEVTGDSKYYDLAKYFIEERGVRPYYFDSEEHPDVKLAGHEDEERYRYHQAHKPVVYQDEAVGHAVRAVYLYSGMADIARISGDEKMLSACKSLWYNITRKKMYITGGIGATHMGEAFSFNYDLPNDTVYAETCASIGMAFFARRMLEIEPNSEYADVLELEMYNGILSGIALDGKSFFYVNPLEVFPKACKEDERKFHVKPVRQKWFGCACCPPNLARFISSIGSYAYTENDNTLFIHQYIGGEINKKCNDGNVLVNIKSGFPWDGKVGINVETDCKDFTLALRIPGWCDDKYRLDGFDGEIEKKNGYIYLKQDWTKNSLILLDFPMEVNFIEADDHVRENIGKVAVMRGPICYCLEEVDNGDELHKRMVAAKGTVEVTDFEIKQEYCKKIKVDGYIYSSISGLKLYHRCSVHSYLEDSLKYIPYYMWANRGPNEMQVWTRLRLGK